VEVGAERAKVCEEGEGEEVKSGLGVQLFISLFDTLDSSASSSGMNTSP
jgi:hypothetical protein